MGLLVSDCMPVKIMSLLHICKGRSAPALDLILPAIKFCVGRHIRFHARFHSGFDKEMLLALDMVLLPSMCTLTLETGSRIPTLKTVCRREKRLRRKLLNGVRNWGMSQ
jgi:hypothetical protein